MSIDCEISTTWYLCCDADDCDASEDITVNGTPQTTEAAMWMRADALGWTGVRELCFCQEHEPADDLESKP